MTTHSKGKQNLFDEFPPVSRQQWEKQIKTDLKGADYNEKLKWDTLEGVKILPFYRSDNLKEYHQNPIPLPAGWLCCEPVDEPDPQIANSFIKKALRGGANSVSIRCRATPHAGALSGDLRGTQLQSQKDLAVLLEDVSLPEISLFFDSGMISPALIAMLQNHLSDETDAAFLFDPFSYTAQHGRMPLPEEKLNSLIRQLSRSGLRTLAADAMYYANAGATLVQEIGIALAIGSEFLARSDEKHLTDTAGSLFVRLSNGPLYFPEIAKTRALRVLWPQMLSGYGIENATDLWIHSETATTNKTATDAHNNMLRATTEAMSAVLGGVNSLVIHPYDAHFQQSSDFSRRIARNVHHILDKEAHLAEVKDAAAGSYYLENLTDSVAEQGWKFFQMIEKQGGFLKALKNRVIQTEIESARTEKEQAYARKKKVLVGTNQYPNSEEKLPGTGYHSEFVSSLLSSGETFNVDENNLLPSLNAAFREGASIGDIIPHILSPQEVLYPTLEEYRAGRVFEQIRFRTIELSEVQNRTPVVVIVPVGNPVMRKARATFSQNALGCAGFKIMNPLGFDSVNEAQKELSQTDADIYVLCSSDKEYPDLVQDFSQTFNGSGKTLILAGHPKENRETYQKAGIDFFIYSGMNLPEFLSDLQQRIFETENA